MYNVTLGNLTVHRVWICGFIYEVLKMLQIPLVSKMPGIELTFK